MSVSNAGLETRDLRLVQAIAEAGGVTRAGKRLCLSQSAVSHQLRGLEERLGVALFRRDGRGLVITPAGQKLVELAHQVLLPLLQAELELKRGLFPERVKLRVAAQCYTAYHWLPKALTALMAEHPDVELVLSGDAVGDAAQVLNDEQSDLVLCVSPPAKGDFIKVALFHDELVLAVPRGHAFTRKKYVVGRDLTNETLIQNTVSSKERDRVKSVLFRNGEGVARVLRLPVSEAVLDLVQAGMGVSIMPSFTLTQRILRGEIEAVRLTRGGFPRAWTGVFPKSSALAAPIRTLLATLKRSGLPDR